MLSHPRWSRDEEGVGGGENSEREGQLAALGEVGDRLFEGELRIEKVDEKAGKCGAQEHPQKGRHGRERTEHDGVGDIFVPPSDCGFRCITTERKIDKLRGEHQRAAEEIGQKAEEPYFPDALFGFRFDVIGVQYAQGENDDEEIDTEIYGQHRQPVKRIKQQEQPNGKEDVVQTGFVFHCGQLLFAFSLL